MGLRDLIVNGLVTTSLLSVGLAGYDRLVREPATPRMAVVDVAKLYGLAEQVATAGALGAPGGGPGGTGGAPGVALNGPTMAAAAGAVGALLRNAEDFGPQLEATLQALSKECNCTLVAMPAVVGDHPSMPDVTQEAARRLRLVHVSDGAPTAGGR